MSFRCFKWAILAASLLVSVGCSSIGTAIGKRAYSHNKMRNAQFTVRHLRDQRFTTADGVELSCEIYLPKGPEKVPTILVRLPLPTGWMSQVRANIVGELWAERGYAVVFQGTRGTFNSGGDFYPLTQERRDGIETLQWVARQPWYNGKLGMWGSSAFGHTQWALWDQEDPGVDAFAIQIASTDFYSMFYPGGALSLESALYWGVRSSQRKERIPTYKTLKPGYDHLPVINADEIVERDLDYYNDWVTHRTRDSYWLTIDGKNRAREITAPAHMLTGWFDAFLPRQLDDFMNIKKGASPEVAGSSRLVIGPWGHANNVTLPGVGEGPDYRKASLDLAIPWFDKHLMETGSKSESPVRIYVMGINKWRDEDTWPLERAVPTKYHLRSGGLLTTNAPSRRHGFDCYDYDPLDPVPSAGGSMLGERSGIELQEVANTRSDVMTYLTPPLDGAMEITGPVKLILYVSTDVQSTDFTGKLLDVHTNGKAYNITDGILRQRYSLIQNNDNRSKVTRLEIELWPTSIVIGKGHRIRLDVSSSNFPRFEKNPNTGGVIATETRTKVAHQRIYRERFAPSHLVLPLVPIRAAE